MKKIAETFWNEPVVVLGVIVGVAAVLSKEHIIAPWISLVVLAIATPIQRALVTPENRLRNLSAIVRKELGI